MAWLQRGASPLHFGQSLLPGVHLVTHSQQVAQLAAQLACEL